MLKFSAPTLKKGAAEQSEAGDFLKIVEHLIMILLYNKYLKPPARHMRKADVSTPAERLLWTYIRKKQIQNIQFYRQKPIGSYIVDFYAPAAKLVIEVDGKHHCQSEYQEQDVTRDEFLVACGLKVLRFGNTEVMSDMDGVLEKICQAMT